MCSRKTCSITVDTFLLRVLLVWHFTEDKMMKKALWAIPLAVGVFMISGSVFAHHSNAVVDKDKSVLVTGTVTRWMFVNPHPAVYLDADVKGSKGDVINWFAAGGGGVQSLARVGWTNKTLKAGDRILAQGHPIRDGRPIMALRRLYRCATGEQVALGYDPANTSEYTTRIVWEDISPERVKQMCAKGTAEGLLKPF